MKRKEIKNILVTGSSGFVGKNLIAELEKLDGINILTFDIEDNILTLEKHVAEADFIFHLAGSNRPHDISEYKRINSGLTDNIIELLVKKQLKIPIVLSSSIQAALDNPYGISKRMAEDVVLAYEKEHDGKAFVFRLPNIFGKWCRPNYNSVIATFCYNIANDIPIQINDGNTQLNLVYIDDVISAFLAVMNNQMVAGDDGFCSVSKTYNKTLDELARMLYLFKESRETLILPDFTDQFTKNLYATFVSYLPENSFAYTTEMKRDDRGWLTELFKSHNFGQIFVSKTKPGITRGNHWHHTKGEKFIVLDGKALIKFRNIYDNSAYEYEVSGAVIQIVDIPTGYTHSITNIGDTELITLFWSDEIFDPAKPDTTFLEV